MAKRLVYELKKIKKDYNNTTGLNVKHLQCHPGTIYGIIGPIGSGKTTLLKILGGKLKPTTGELIFDGEEFKSNWRGKIIPFEDIWYGSLEELDDKKTVSQLFEDNSLLGENNKDSYFHSKDQNRLLSEQIKNLSQGEKSWLIKCLLKNKDPRVVILDDYGIYLDRKRELELQKTILKMNKVLGTTLILGSNDDRNIRKFASVLIYFDRGHISKIRPGTSHKKSRRK